MNVKMNLNIDKDNNVYLNVKMDNIQDQIMFVVIHNLKIVVML